MSLAALILILPGRPASAGTSVDAELDQLRALLANACRSGAAEDAGSPGLHHESATRITSEPVMRSGATVGRRFNVALAGGDEMRVDLLIRHGMRVRVNVEYRRRAAFGLSPSTLVIADSSCNILGGRRLEYGSAARPRRLVLLAADLAKELRSELLDAPVPAPRGVELNGGSVKGSSADARHVIVAMVDSGVNYTLPEVRDRLARGPGGELVGYDYWDMDERPFDSSPSRSPYAPGRHGTRTASLLLAEAPQARLAPYRYPRPDLGRMRALVEHAAARGVRIINLSLGGGRRDEWAAFEVAAAAAREILFVASAGNDDRNIDDRPVYPGALDLPNLITVTSAENDGRLARGSNWGSASVDLMVPAERQQVIGFDGYARLASGSSYAAARVSALAACLLAQHPHWSGAQLRATILRMAIPAPEGPAGRTAHGLLPDPIREERGVCAPEPQRPVISSRVNIHLQAAAGATHALELTLARLDGAGWSEQTVEAAGRHAAAIISQCEIGLPKFELLTVSAPRRMRYFEDRWSSALLRELELEQRGPAAFFVSGTLQPEPFEAEAVGRANGRRRPRLIGTAWLTRALEHPGVALAHELVHLLTDSGAHDADPSNLMHARTSEDSTRLHEIQCQRIRATGTRLGLLRELPG
ncbi:MAG: S8 family serine peptidase [Gammaproteobacteria bacterium]